ncbi:MAG: hypothetical protein AAFX96_10900, partial [Pseudomonadota bacterium]
MNETKPVSRQAGFLHNTHLDEVKLPCACRSLQNFMEHKNWSLERLSDAIGDDPRRHKNWQVRRVEPFYQ